MSGEILLIDDDPFLGHFLEMFLRRKGMGLTVVESGEEGLELLKERDFGLVLLDLDLADMSALEVLGRICDGRPAPSVVVITADLASEPDCLEAQRLGAAGVLEKPFDLQQAYDAIRSLLRPAPIPAGRQAVSRAESRPPELLVIDDDPFVCSLLQEIGRKHNWKMNVAASGEAGLSLMEQCGIDLVLLDLCMPEMSGLEVLARMHEGSPVPPVIVMTGKSGADSECAEALRLGAAGVLAKPFTVQDFYATVDSFLHRLPSCASRV